MKHLKTIKLVAATGLVLGSLNAAASGFGGGWMHDKHTGTLYYSLAPEPEQQATAEKQQSGGHMNSFGGGWVQDKNTGTIYYSHADKVKQGTGFSPS